MMGNFTVKFRFSRDSLKGYLELNSWEVSDRGDYDSYERSSSVFVLPKSIKHENYQSLVKEALVVIANEECRELHQVARDIQKYEKIVLERKLLIEFMQEISLQAWKEATSKDHRNTKWFERLKKFLEDEELRSVTL
jgi:hypothetical protein